MTDTGYFGNLDPDKGAGQYNAMTFLIQSILARVNTIGLVKVVSVTNSGGVSPVGYVDMVPLVNQLDGSQKAIPHKTIYNIPYMRLQGGANAVILDPQVGDIGVAAYAAQDISVVKATKAQSNPGSARTFNMADGLYFGGFLNGAPTQYIGFASGGVTVKSPNAVTIDAPSTTITGTLEVKDAVTMDTTLQVNASVQTQQVTATTGATIGGKDFSTHEHSGVATGTGKTGGVV